MYHFAVWFFWFKNLNTARMNKIKIETEDQFQLSATFYESEQHSDDLVVIAPATAATQLFYRSYSRYLAKEKEMNVLTFDYRGVGESLPGDIKSFDASMSDWGFKDLRAVINWAHDQGHNIYLLGHSVAGQLFPFTESANKVCASYFVASQTASMHFWEGKAKLFVLLFWRFLLPIVTKVYGYLPGWTLGAQTPLPKGVAQEWRSWGLHKDGAIQGIQRLQEMYNQVTGYVHFLNIGDDKYLAPRNATEQLKWRYFSARTSMESVYPQDIEEEEIGHFGFFRSEFKHKLWDKPVDYFRAMAC